MIEKSEISKGIDFRKTLRFDIILLRIEYNYEWQEIPEFESGEVSLGTPITLKYVLFDTGNEEGNCNLTYHYYKNFSKRFPQIKFNHKEGNTIRSKKKVNLKFRDKIEFESYIGFRYSEDNDFPPEWINCINIGIDSILQFISIIYPLDSINRIGKFLCQQ